MTDVLSERAVLALDIGGTKLAAAVVGSDGVVRGHRVTPTRREEGPDAVIRRLFDLGRSALDAEGVAVPLAVGISCGGPLDAAQGVLLSPLHLPGWTAVPMVDLAEREFGVPARLENDATLGALGEFRFGHGRAVPDGTLVYLTLSTGVGGGAVINGRLHEGAAGNGGEFGHVVVRYGGRSCPCGRAGCLETYASGTNIAVRARERLAQASDTVLAAYGEQVRAEHVTAAAAAGDQVARELWDETVDVLADAVTDFVNVFEPDLVVLGGGVTTSEAPLLEPLRQAVSARAMRPAARKAQVHLSALGAQVCLAGAAAAAFDLVADGAREIVSAERVG
ncbi:ROK family protein [Isoptericola sp. NPDC056618]|uniref:ROK family protein n=1 Tax=Isoptericola sp. NPDC056618 TaxID=3345878 RepID=UPI0036817BD2